MSNTDNTGKTTPANKAGAPVATFELWGLTWEVQEARNFREDQSGPLTLGYVNPALIEDPANFTGTSRPARATIRGTERYLGSTYIERRRDGGRWVAIHSSGLTEANQRELTAAIEKATDGLTLLPGKLTGEEWTAQAAAYFRSYAGSRSAWDVQNHLRDAERQGVNLTPAQRDAVRTAYIQGATAELFGANR